MIEKFYEKDLIFWNEEREKQQNDTKLKIFRKSNTNFSKILRENTKRTPNLEFLRIKKALKTCKFEN